ncbi:uncharacterized protein LOC106163658 [Lingula anatina]|uniref:Uncharacterized protein LOC106163658 n=1 Tax=Lingula anatina TaxID=7574 RepID=A0A1S3IFY0_LINAN|nr:uncharacterized protein LOC106163658 [Lingula anatina]|eukprot:XP_013396771.1 uncharacterized protein LOC106163658 [Lingula anatina]
MRLSGLSEIPEELACSQKLKEWGRRKCSVTVPGKFSDLDFVRYQPGKDPISIGHSKCKGEYAVLPPTKQSLPKPRLDNFVSRVPEGSVRKLMLAGLWSSSEKSVNLVGAHPEHKLNVLQPHPLQNIRNKVSEQIQTWDFESKEFQEMQLSFTSVVCG